MSGERHKKRGRATQWMVIATSRSVEGLRRSAEAVRKRWPGKYRFRIELQEEGIPIDMPCASVMNDPSRS